MSEILVGYEVSDDPRRAGRAVYVPLKHTAVLGQTQESGKTTTQEAMITRSGLRAIAFLTKRGEQSFRLARPIKPFFQEAHEDYYRYVIAAIEGMLEMKLGQFERQLILKLCRDYEKATGAGKKKQVKYQWRAATGLSAVLDNVRAALPSLRGRDEGTAMQLEEYLKSIIPEIEASDFAATLKVQPGINVMDITKLSMGLQSLVISSVIEWVHEREKNTIVIIPEAWKFIPEGRSSTVKRAAERLIREGAVLKNFVWIDSQDLRGIDKTILRSVPVWLFGVQREKNEVENTIKSMPAVPKPTANDVIRLSKGQFLVAYGDTLVKTYVRPAGMEAEHAQAIARGEESAESWRSIVRTLDEQTENGNSKIETGEEDDARNGGDGDAAGEIPRRLSRDETEAETLPAKSAISSAGDRTASEEFGNDGAADRANGADDPLDEEEDEMWKEKHDQLKIEFDKFQESQYRPLLEAHDKTAKRLELVLDRLQSFDPHIDAYFRAYGDIEMSDRLRRTDVPCREPASGGLGGLQVKPAPGTESGNGAGISTPAPAAAESVNDAPSPGANNFPHGGVPSYNDIYQYVVQRAKGDVHILKLLVDRPELQVEIPRRVIALSDDSTQGRLGLLIKDKFFDSPRDAGDITREFKRRGWFEPKASNAALIKPLGQIAEWGFLTRETDGFQSVPGMKVNVVTA